MLGSLEEWKGYKLRIGKGDPEPDEGLRDTEIVPLPLLYFMSMNL